MTDTLDKVEKKEAFKPITFWLANPHRMLKIYDERGFPLVKFVNGRFTATTPKQVELIRRNGTAYEQDLPKPPRPHPGSGYAPQSQDAYELHQELFPSNQ